MLFCTARPPHLICFKMFPFFLHTHNTAQKQIKWRSSNRFRAHGSRWCHTEKGSNIYIIKNNKAHFVRLLLSKKEKHDNSKMGNIPQGTGFYGHKNYRKTQMKEHTHASGMFHWLLSGMFKSWTNMGCCFLHRRVNTDTISCFHDNRTASVSKRISCPCFQVTQWCGSWPLKTAPLCACAHRYHRWRRKNAGPTSGLTFRIHERPERTCLMSSKCCVSWNIVRVIIYPKTVEKHQSLNSLNSRNACHTLFLLVMYKRDINFA